MNFSGSTRVATSRYQPKSSGRAPTGEDFDMPGFKSAGITTNAGSAADAVSTASIYSELRQNAPK